MTFYEIKNKIDNLVYKLFNILSEVVFFVNFPIKRLVSRNIKYKGIHEGEVCYIVGTGPSLNDLSDDDFVKINKCTVFGVSSLYKSEAFKRLNIKYYSMIDNVYWNESSSDLSNIGSYFQDPPVLITDYRAEGVISNSDIDPENVLYLYTKKYPISGVDFNLCGNVSAVNNVVSYSILTAMYMGFDTIYLVGCDYNSFCYRGAGHCYDDSDSTTSYNLEYYLNFFAITTKFHYEISKTAKINGIGIVNVTKGSLLDAYKRASM